MKFSPPTLEAVVQKTYPFPILALQDPRPVSLAEHDGTFVESTCPERRAMGREFLGFYKTTPYPLRDVWHGIHLVCDTYHEARPHTPFRLEGMISLPVWSAKTAGAFVKYFPTFDAARAAGLEWVSMAVPLVAAAEGQVRRALALTRQHWPERSLKNGFFCCEVCGFSTPGEHAGDPRCTVCIQEKRLVFPRLAWMPSYEQRAA